MGLPFVPHIVFAGAAGNAFCENKYEVDVANTLALRAAARPRVTVVVTLNCRDVTRKHVVVMEMP